MPSQSNPKITQLKDLLDISKTIVVIVKDQPGLDQLVTAASLSLGLQKIGKEVHFLTPSEIKSDSGIKKNLPANLQNNNAVISSDILENVSGLDNLSYKMGNQNLVVSFDYSETSVDKVSYHIGEESGKFFLTVKPQKGHPPLDSSQVEFAYTGMDADLIFLVGVHDLESLENLYFGHESFYNDVPIVTIHSFETEIGLVKLDFSSSLCFAEASIEVLEGLQIPLDMEIATNLLLSIEEKTQGMTSMNTTANTFEVVAKLLRAGARRHKVFFPRTIPEQVSHEPVSQNKNISIETSRSTNNVFEGDRSVKKKVAVSKNYSKKNGNNPSSKNKKQGGLNHKPSGFRS